MCQYILVRESERESLCVCARESVTERACVGVFLCECGCFVLCQGVCVCETAGESVFVCVICIVDTSVSFSHEGLFTLLFYCVSCTCMSMCVRVRERICTNMFARVFFSPVSYSHEGI